MNDLAGIITATVGVLTAVGGAGRFVWNKIKRRFAEIDRELAECRQRETDSIQRRATQLTVIELLWQEVHRFSPNSPVLTRGKKLLDELKDGSKP